RSYCWATKRTDQTDACIEERTTRPDYFSLPAKIATVQSRTQAIYLLHGCTSSVGYLSNQTHKFRLCAGHSSCCVVTISEHACTFVHSCCYDESRACRYCLLARSSSVRYVTGPALKPLPLSHTSLHPPSPSRVGVPLHTTSARLGV
ncbi:unnamed protein product, partial [Ectocarpus sp. 6 AP-2014]